MNSEQVFFSKYIQSKGQGVVRATQAAVFTEDTLCDVNRYAFELYTQTWLYKSYNNYL